MRNKRGFGWIEVIFDTAYLVAVFWIGILLLTGTTQAQRLAGSMALLLGFGDAFHLLPRMASVIIGDEHRMQHARGFGKLITSITMTVFYVLLWHLAAILLTPDVSQLWTWLVYALAGVRILLCMAQDNQWLSDTPPLRWAIYRNIPFVLLGLVVGGWYAVYGSVVPALQYAWLAVLLSFLFYLPVVLFANKVPPLGMLMMPKTVMYIWLLWMFVQALPVA